ncbi:flagellar hook-associated protein FlgL [Solidesulfovibrio sp.]|uniref:flagellar hook-associated protein FlgL n=1 Tax=Solidesulfovibrio sp. TaxID=2910990 RepID=UPI00260E730F|nr:flagellar hook-associated protein FlgL [Solidesulfovibrio sp.]
MVMRVTQQTLYGSVIRQNNASLAKLMETNNQASTQKRINAPSDDPNGAVQVLGTRTDLSQLTQYQRNIDTAQGWLNQADSTLTSVSTLVTTIKEQAEQAATGTVSQENRGEIASAVRQYFEQLITMANTTYNGQSLFAGQKTGDEAYTMGLGITSNDDAFTDALDDLPAPGYTIKGDSDSTILVQFTDNTTPDQPAFRYTTDGGSTWQTGSYATPPPSADTETLQLGSVSMTLSHAALNSVTPSADTDDTDGTWLWIRPTAYYQGNTNDDVAVTYTGASGVTGTATGTFSGNVQVKITDAPAGGPYTYSYSTDGGSTWVDGNTSGTNADGNPALPVPGGILTLDETLGTPAAGDQFLIRPSTADITIGISPTDSVVVNGVGKDIFGGMYQTTASNASTTSYNTAATFDGSVSGNLFETVGKLVGYLETNNQSGIQECLDALTDSQNQVLVTAASVGAKENRVSSAGTMVTTLTENATTTLSNVEDADLTTLITKLSEQELAYQAVLKSSSMVMNLSLVSYI